MKTLFVCPDRKTLLKWLTGQLSDESLDEIYAHVASCSGCQKEIMAIEGEDSLIEDLGELVGIVELPEACERMLLKSQNELGQTRAAGKDKSVTRLANDRIHDYVLRELLGVGGMGAVYRAEHVWLRREVAIKILSPQRLHSLAAVERFEHEMLAVGKLAHPNIVTAFDAGCEEGIHYLVMELIEGFDGSQLVERLGPLSFADAAKITLLAAEGLQHAHEQGFVHRDMKPSNLMVTTDGNVQVLDLGLSLWEDTKRPTPKACKIVGTLNYMAPEQLVDSERVDHRADIYSLGNTFFFLVHGRLADHNTPSEKRSQEESISEGCEEASIPAELTEFLDRMLAESADDRPGSAAEVAAQLRPWASDADLALLVQRAEQIGPKRTEAIPPFILSAWLEPRKKGWRDLWNHFSSWQVGVVLSIVVLGFFISERPRHFWRGKEADVSEKNPKQQTSKVRAEPEDSSLSQSTLQDSDSQIAKASTPRYAIPVEDYKGEQEIYYEAIVEDSQYEWFLRMGTMRGIRVTRKRIGAKDDSQESWESIDIAQFRNEHPRKFSLMEKYLPKIPPSHPTLGTFVKIRITDLQKPLSPEVRMKRAVQNSFFGGQDVWVRTRHQRITIHDRGIGGIITVEIRSDGQKLKSYAASNRIAFRRDQPEIAALIDRYAKPRVVAMPGFERSDVSD